MKFYMSYWSYADTSINENTNLVRFFKEKSIRFLRKNYKEIHLITDNLGLEKFGDLNWTSVSTDLESLPKKYGSVWSAGKLWAINKAARKKEPFFHIDYDFMLIKPLKDEFLQADILVEHPYDPYGNSDSIFSPPFDCPSYFLKNCKDLFINDIAHQNKSHQYGHAKGFKYFVDPSLVKQAFNCGIIGGWDYKFFTMYATCALNMLFCKENQEFWLTDWEKHNILCPKFNRSTKALLLEQFYLGLFAAIYGWPVKCLLNKRNLNEVKSKIKTKSESFDGKDLTWLFKHKESLEEMGYIHFLGLMPKIFAVKNLYDYPDKEKIIKSFLKNMNPAQTKIDYDLIESMSWIKDSIIWKD